MYKVLALTLFLGGCSSTVKTTTETYNPVYMPPTVHVKYCYSTWDNTPRGYVERKICSQDRQLSWQSNRLLIGLSQVRPLYGLPIYGLLAQLVEHRTFNPRVLGSSPREFTIYKEFILAKSNKHAGQFDLRGKKSLRLRCHCCIVQDFRDSLESKRIKKEIKESLGHSSVGRANA